MIELILTPADIEDLKRMQLELPGDDLPPEPLESETEYKWRRRANRRAWAIALLFAAWLIFDLRRLW